MRGLFLREHSDRLLLVFPEEGLLIRMDRDNFDALKRGACPYVERIGERDRGHYDDGLDRLKDMSTDEWVRDMNTEARPRVGYTVVRELGREESRRLSAGLSELLGLQEKVAQRIEEGFLKGTVYGRRSLRDDVYGESSPDTYERSSQV